MTPKILHLHRVPPHPPTNGGQVRVWEMAKKLSEYGEVHIASTWDDDSQLPNENINKANINSKIIDEKILRIYLWNLFMVSGSDNIYNRYLINSIIQEVPDFSFELVVCESPQLAKPAIQIAQNNNCSILMNKHNCYYDFLSQYLASYNVPSLIRLRAVKNLREFEQESINASDFTVFQSDNDLEKFETNSSECTVIPNGTGSNNIDGSPDKVCDEIGVDKTRPVILFLGSYDYSPNKEAAKIIVNEISNKLPEFQFILAGRNPPDVSKDNIFTPGFVEDLDGLLELSDIALCPLVKGSGTKLKMLDYLAAGLPVVTTTVGTQGIPIKDGEDAIVRDKPEEIAKALDDLIQSEKLRQKLSNNGRELATEYSWRNLMQKYDPILRDLLD